jgi:hypothetical protein
MTDSVLPVVAERIAVFGDDQTDPAHILYDLPANIHHNGRRTVRLNAPAEAWKPEAYGIGRDLRNELNLKSPNGKYTFNVVAALWLLREELQAEGASETTLRGVDAAIALISRRGNEDAQSNGESAIELLSLELPSAQPITPSLPSEAVPAVRNESMREGAPLGGKGLSLPSDYQGPLEPRGSGLELALEPINPTGRLPAYLPVFLSALTRGELVLPRRKWSGELTLVRVTLPDTSIPEGPSTNRPEPTLFLVEDYELMAESAGFGLGRTLRVATFLPGVSLAIPIIAWRPNRLPTGTNVLDSFSVPSANDFSARIVARFGDNQTRTLSRQFSSEIMSTAGFSPLISDAQSRADLAMGFGRREWCKAVERALLEHCRRASDLRTTTQDVADELRPNEPTWHTANNVNLRVAMSAVYRQLNRRFRYQLRLTDVRLAFANGRFRSWTELPIWSMRPLLETVVVDDAVESVERIVLDSVKGLLEYIQPSDGDSEQLDTHLPEVLPRLNSELIADASLLQGSVEVATGSVLGEVLLGQADALDRYALALQASDAEARDLQNKLQEVLREALEAIQDPAARADAFASAYRPDGALRLRLEQPE